MKEPINLIKLLAELPKRRRGKACIVLTQEAEEQKAWASKLASLTNAKHIDLLDRFVEDGTLGSKVSMFSVDDLFSLLGQEKESAILIVTGLEFLFAAWSGRSSVKEDFAKRLEFWVKSPALLFVTQQNSSLAKRKFDQRFQQVFVVEQQDTLAL